MKRALVVVFSSLAAVLRDRPSREQDLVNRAADGFLAATHVATVK